MDAQPQHLSALQRANELRMAKARSKEALKEGRMDLAEALTLECWQKASIYRLLIAQKSWGEKRAIKLLSRLGIGQQRLIGHLTPRQRSELLRSISQAKIGTKP